MCEEVANKDCQDIYIYDGDDPETLVEEPWASQKKRDTRIGWKKLISWSTREAAESEAFSSGNIMPIKEDGKKKYYF